MYIHEELRRVVHLLSETVFEVNSCINIYKYTSETFIISYITDYILNDLIFKNLIVGNNPKKRMSEISTPKGKFI